VISGYLGISLLVAGVSGLSAAFIWIVGRSLIRFYFAHKSRYLMTLEASIDPHN